MGQIYSKIFGRQTRDDSISISSAQSNNDVTMGSALGIEQADTSQGTSNFPNARGNNQCVGNQTINTHIDTVHNYPAATPSIPDDFNYELPNDVMEIIGREEEMDQLEECLNKDRRVTIVGMGGVGKTTLAYNYARKWATQSRKTIVIDSETNETITSCIKGLAACLKVSNADKMPPVELFKEIVRLLNKGSKVLFVYDNVTEFSKLHNYLPPKHNKNIYTLFTSQMCKFDSFKDFDLKVLNTKNSVKLIKSKLDKNLWNSDEKMKDVNALLDIMQGLPLAILQAAAHIKLEYSCSPTYRVKQYIDTYREHLLDSDKECPYSDNSEDSYKKTVYWAVKMNIELMKKDKDFKNYIKHASKCLYSICHLNPERTTKTMLSGMVENEEILNKIIFILTKYSLCDQYEKRRDIYLRTHRLILEVLAKLLHNETNEYKKDISVNAARAVIRRYELRDHRVFFLPFLRTDWLYEAFISEVKSEVLINKIKENPLWRYSNIKLNVSLENITFYHYAAYFDIPEVFVNMTLTDVRHSDNIKSLGQIYEERKSSMIQDVNKQNECVMSENDGRVLVALADSRLSYECVRILVSGGAPATCAVYTLWRAVRAGNTIFVRELLDRGAPPDCVTWLGCTPLFAAAGTGYVDVMEELLSRGASVDKAYHDGRTPLHGAVLCGRVEAVRCLLAHGANPAARDRYGITPLHILHDEYNRTDNYRRVDKDQILKQIRNMLQESLNIPIT